ncbi:MAG: HIT family protein [Candidatus Daviesbacteria bacterium]|nr:HIT family protein [Candidatus Daviesbacteria bacterium]
MDNLTSPNSDKVFYEDEKVYACLASFPITKGHSIVVWKKPVTDLHLLSREDYEYLMNIVDKTRDTLMKVMKVDKVYLMYMDEIKHVHWHLIPRHNLMGFNLLKHKPKKLTSFKLVEKLTGMKELANNNR